MRERVLRAAASVGPAALAAALALWNTRGAPLHEGDEAIYAQIAREMLASGDWLRPVWQGEPIYARPPGAYWPLALGHAIFSDEMAVRAPLALVCTAQVALVAYLGTRWFGARAGLAAGLTLAVSDLFLGYARYVESEPFWITATVAAVLAWDYSREQTHRRAATIFGIALALAALTKQLVGLLALLAPITEALSVDARARDGAPPVSIRKRLVASGLAFAAVWLPWHVAAVARDGWLPMRLQYVGNIVERSLQSQHARTSALFYVQEIVRSERVGAALFVLGLVAAAARARFDLRARLVLAWALVPLVIFSVARSRYDYYVLAAYPAFALAAGCLFVVQVRGLRGLVQPSLAALLLALGAWQHVPRNTAPFRGAGETRALLRRVQGRPPSVLLVCDVPPYASRYYAPPTTRVRWLVGDATEHRLVSSGALGLPRADAAYAPVPYAALAAAPDGAMMLTSRRVGDRLAIALPVVARGPALSLLRGPPPAPR